MPIHIRSRSEVTMRAYLTAIREDILRGAIQRLTSRRRSHAPTDRERWTWSEEKGCVMRTARQGLVTSATLPRTCCEGSRSMGSTTRLQSAS